MIEGAILDKRGEKDLSDEVREEHSRRANSLCKGLGAGVCSEYVYVNQQGSWYG